MHYIKIDRSNLEQDPKKYTYLIELNDNNSFENGIIIGINKDEQQRNKLVHGVSSGTLWRWIENRSYKLNEEEIEKYKISREEFYENWQK